MAASKLFTIGATALLMAAQNLGAPDASASDRHRGQLIGEYETSKQVYVKEPPPPQTLGKPFELMDHNGRTVTNASYPGKWLVVFFGFAGCRESCPIGLDAIGTALDALGPNADKVQPLFVDVSMDEPDLAGLKQFVGNFDPRIIGLTGTRAQTFAVVRDFKVRREYAMMNYSAKETGPRLNHTSYFYLVDPQGVTRAYFYHNLEPEKMAETIGLHLKRQQASNQQPEAPNHKAEDSQ
jgi:protein SCO1/2